MKTSFDSVDRAFSKQSAQFDENDRQNPLLTQMRQQVYDHVERFLKPASFILELNAGTGIDATHFVLRGHHVLATDVASGMIRQIETKIDRYSLAPRLQCKQVSFEHLDQLETLQADYIFSNFGGLNCAPDLSLITNQFHKILKPGGVVTLVIMPPVCLWELFSAARGNFSKAFRRFHRNGTMAHLEGEHFKTYYYSLSDITKALGSSFRLLAAEGLAAITPPPHRPDIPKRFPRLYKFLVRLDRAVKDRFPFNRWADHIIVTYYFEGHDKSPQ